MPKVHFAHDNITVEVEAGTSLEKAAAEAGASFPFGCHMGSCGTCRCHITKGLENANPKTEEELELFSALTSVRDDERLGCQLTINGDMTIEI